MTDACEMNPLALLLGLAERLNAHVEGVAADLSLTPAQGRLLSQLERPSRMGDVAHERLCDPSSLTTMVQRLERDGLVVRVVDPDDARARLITLTPKGRRIRERYIDGIGDGVAVIDQLPSEHRQALVRLLDRPRA